MENQQIFSHTLEQSNRNLHEKFERLKEAQNVFENIKYDESFIKNLSDVEIPQEVMTVLSLGPKFAITPETTPILDVASEVEAIIAQELPEEVHRQVRGETVYTITKFAKQHQELNRIEKYLQKASKTAAKFVKEHRHLMVSNSDHRVQQKRLL